MQHFTSGSGYLVACIGAYMKLFGKGKPKVFGIDHVPELVKTSLNNMNSDRPDLLESGIAQIIGMARTVGPKYWSLTAPLHFTCLEGDGYKGMPSEAPFDCIHVGAAAPSAYS
jgi:protein-L-isoaspartate(D-aspartate) O-methyltransferase